MLLASALCIINRASGTGRTPADLEHLRETFEAEFAAIPHRAFVVTAGHAEVTAQTRAFLTASPAPHFLLAGGGGGTTRALVQGLMEAAEAGEIQLAQVRVGCLRLGSGNVVAKYLGVPADHLTGLRQVAHSLLAGHTLSLCIYRCTFLPQAGHPSAPLYGLTLGLVGPLARIPSEVEGWKNTHPARVRQITRWLSLEKLTLAQYGLLGLHYTLQCLLQQRRAERVGITAGDRMASFRLLAGLLLNFDIPALPFKSNCQIGELRLGLHCLPLSPRHWFNPALTHYEITPTAPLTLAFPEGAAVVALDEDTYPAPAALRLEAAACLNFVPAA
jgi:hypothetical protein